MKLKIGDKVKLNEKIGDFKYGRAGVVYNEVGKVEMVYHDKVVIDFPSHKCWVGLESEVVKVEFTKADLKAGDIVTLRNGNRLVYAIGVFSDLTDDYNNPISCINNFKEDLTYEYDKKDYDIIKVERTVKYETIFERENEILDDVEREYLNNVIRPFRKDVNYIQKIRYNENEEFIYIDIKNYEEISLPNFKKDSMYKGMERGKEYTLEELGLDKENE